MIRKIGRGYSYDHHDAEMARYHKVLFDAAWKKASLDARKNSRSFSKHSKGGHVPPFLFLRFCFVCFKEIGPTSRCVTAKVPTPVAVI
jgi:hypothetical protein